MGRKECAPVDCREEKVRNSAGLDMAALAVSGYSAAKLAAGSFE